MSTRSSIYYNNKKENKHSIIIHIYKELTDDLTYLELGCSGCGSGICVPISEHIAEELIKVLPEEE
jgi:hypothetical protein